MVLTAKVGVTGSSGLLGKHVVQYFLKKNCKIIGTSRTKPKVYHKNFLWKKLDLYKKINNKKLNIIFKDINCLIHMGAYVPKKTTSASKNFINKVNIDSTINLLKWSQRNNIHFIYISGSVIYNKNRKNSENSKLLKNSKNPYIDSKIKCEKKILRLLKNKNHNYTIFRPSSIYGFGLDKSKLISKFIKILQKNKVLEIFNFEKTKVNFIHAKDVASAIYLSFKLKKKGVFNVGSKNCYHFLSLSKILAKLIKSKSNIILRHNKKIKNLNSLDVKITKANKILNWRPVLSMRNGLKMTLQKKWN